MGIARALLRCAFLPLLDLSEPELSKLEGCWFAPWRSVGAKGQVAECLSTPSQFCAILSHSLQVRRRGFGSGTTEGRCGRRSVRPKAVLEGGPEDLPRENFVKKTQNPAFWELLHTSGAVCSRVEYSTQYDSTSRSGCYAPALTVYDLVTLVDS